jgi:hypothetical protein
MTVIAEDRLQSTMKIFAPIVVDERCAASPWSDTW